MEKITLPAETVEPLATIGTLAKGSPDTCDQGPLNDVLTTAIDSASRRADSDSDEVEMFAVHVSTLVGYSRDGIREARKAGRMDDMAEFESASDEARKRLRETGVWD
jgi:hypothetical protein